MRFGRFLRRLRLFIRVFAVIGQVQRAFLTTGTNEASDRDERSKGRDQALHGEILENALIAPEYTGHPAACLCDGPPVRRAFARRLRSGSQWWAFMGPPCPVLGRYPLQSPGRVRILRRLSVSRHFLRLPQ